jgi:hypothetical protein
VSALLQAGPGRPSHACALFRELILSRARGSCRSRVLRGMGTRGARFTSSEPRATFSRRCPFEGCHRLEPRARAARGVLRGMGARGACFISSRPRAAFSRRCPFQGCHRLEPRARAARGFCMAWVPAVPALHQASPERPSHVDVPSRAVIVLSRGLVPLEGFAWHGCPRCPLYIKRAPSDLLTSMSLRGLSSS